MGRDDERLADILAACEKIALRVSRGRQEFDDNEDLRLAVLHLVQVVGEAVSGLSDELSARHPAPPWRQIIDMRNRVVHGSFAVDVDVLWDVARIDMAKLAEQVRTMV